MDKPAPAGFSCVTVAETTAHECSAQHARQYQRYTPSDPAYAGTCRELDPPASFLAAATDAYTKNKNNINKNKGNIDAAGVSSPLMVMMTTVGAFQSASPVKKTLQGGAAVTWEALEPEIQMVVAVDSVKDESPGGMQRVLCDANMHGTPFIGAMLQHTTNKAVAAGARFVGYTNADIAFSSSLIDMLKGVSASIDDGIISDRLLLIGKRLNIHEALNDAAELIHLNTSYWDAVVDQPRTAAKRATPQFKLRDSIRKALVTFSHRSSNTWMTEFSEDFFFFTANTFKDLEFPQFVAGRVGWDSWLVQWALDNDVHVIDTTKLLHVSHLTADDGNLAGWNTARPDKMWNYCALDEWCKRGASTAWNDFCQSCFRCKLGGVKQGAFRLKRGATRGSLEVENVGDRDPEVAALEEMENIAVIANILRDHKLPKGKASSFWTAVKEQTPLCRSKGKCCSMTGNWGVQHELRAGFDIRGVWPKNGVYPSTKLGASSREKGGAASEGGQGAVAYRSPSFAPIPKAERWCKPWEDNSWPNCEGPPPASTVQSL